MPNCYLAELLQELCHQEGHFVVFETPDIIWSVQHAQRGPPIVYGDVKLNNVRVDADFEGHFGLGKAGSNYHRSSNLAYARRLPWL